MEMCAQRRPLAKQIIAGFAQVGTRQDLSELAQPLGELFEDQLGKPFDGKTGAPGDQYKADGSAALFEISYNLSDEAVEFLWVENPYWQHFSYGGFSIMNFRLIHQV